MNNRLAPGVVQESLQHRGAAPAYAPVRRAAQHSQHQHSQDPASEHDGSADPKPKPKGKPIQLEGLQTTAGESARAPPKGRPQVFYSTVADGTLEPHEPSPSTAVHLPIPPRPSSSVPGDALQQRRLPPGGTGVKSDPTTSKAPVQDPPASAAVFPGGKPVDLFPWTGGHPEDVLSEALVKAGISNKSQLPNETNTARPSLWANLKNKSGTSTLSTLFIAVLEKRQASSRITAPNTFKPPPRLTLRDSTRETWLHDLANPTVGLRRLSRTIPHGITGKVLLDQCLNKNIPLPRAIWLAKCVGINEMRAHKRKGQAGTITWVRGWTSSVEQFLDGVISAVGQPDWKVRITYALQLTAHLFKENLLEEEHFIDWIQKSLESCTMERLFLWLLIACIPDFWQSLTSSRRRGKRLNESLLTHAKKLYQTDAEPKELSVLTFLESVLTKIFITVPSSLLLPQTWEKHADVLRTFARRRNNAKIMHIFVDLEERNKAILCPPSLELPIPKYSLSAFFRLLDGVDYKKSIAVEGLAFECMQMVPDHTQLVSAVLQWASSLYRQGLHRLYLATRLLRKWSQIGIDVGEGIMLYLPSIGSDLSKETRVVFRIIAELIRSKTFSLGRYLHWLIATGSLNQAQHSQSSSPWPLRLLTEVPLAGLSEQVYNLRSTLLRGTLYCVETEEKLIISTEEAILQQLPNLFNPGGIVYDLPKLLDVDCLSQTVRLETAMWLRGQVASTVHITDHSLSKHDMVSSTSSNCTITRPDFDIIRTYIEKFDDLSILADIIGLATFSYDSHVLSASADALCYHYKVFKAIGAFDSLFDGIASRYINMRTMRLPDRGFLLSFGALSRLGQVDGHTMQLLDYDLSRYDQKNSIAACSPASDTIAENIGNLDPADEIERILSSGSSMDPQTMSRVFAKVVSYLERGGKGSQSNDNISSWFYRLRSFDEHAFHTIVTSWIGSIMMSHQPHLLSTALPLLVCSGCLTLSGLLATIQDCVRRSQQSHPAESFSFAMDGLERLLPNNESCDFLSDQYAYQFRTEQGAFCQKEDSGLLGFVKEIFELSTTVDEARCEERFLQILANNRFLDILKHYAIMDSQNLSFLLDISKRAPEGTTCARINSLFDHLLGPLSSLDLSRMSYEQQASLIYERTDQLSLPFCQLKLQHLFILSAAGGQSAESIPCAFMDFLKTTSEHDHLYWLDLVSGLDAALTNMIQDRAEEEILRYSAFLCDGIPERDEYELDQPPFVRRCLEVVQASCKSNKKEAQVTVLMPLVERFKGVVDLLGQISNGSKTSHYAKINESISNLSAWLNALLQLLVLQNPALVQKANHQQQAALMTSLQNLFTHPHLENAVGVSQYTFDVATYLSDYIAEDVRKHLSRVVYAKGGSDPRSTFIFGSEPQPDGWLGLVKPVPPQQLQTPGSMQSQMQGQQSNAGNMLGQRGSSQQQYQQGMQSQAQTRSFGYQQHQQTQRVLPQQLQRAASSPNHPTSQLQQMQQMQQMQAMSQQRIGPPQRSSSGSSQTATAGKAGPARQERVDSKPIPFTVNRWELLPETGTSATGNETAISLSLFGARKV